MQIENINRTLRSLPAALLIFLFVYAAASKMVDLDKYRVALYSQVFPHAVAKMLLYLIPTAELVTAGLIFFTRTELAGLRTSLVLLVVFTAYIALALLNFWERFPCSCGGILSNLSWLTHLIFNCLFIAINLIAIHIYFKERRATK